MLERIFSVVPPPKKTFQARNVWEFIETFQCAEFKANGHWLFRSIPSYFSSLRQLVLVKQYTSSPHWHIQLVLHLLAQSSSYLYNVSLTYTQLKRFSSCPVSLHKKPQHVNVGKRWRQRRLCHWRLMKISFVLARQVSRNATLEKPVKHARV